MNEKDIRRKGLHQDEQMGMRDSMIFSKIKSRIFVLINWWNKEFYGYFVTFNCKLATSVLN